MKNFFFIVTLNLLSVFVSGQNLPIPVIDSVTSTIQNKTLITWHVDDNTLVKQYVVYRKTPEGAGYIVLDTIRNTLQTNFIDFTANPETEQWLYTIASMSYTDSLSGLATPHALPIITFGENSLCRQTTNLSWTPYTGIENIEYTIICETDGGFNDKNSTGSSTVGEINLVSGSEHRIFVKASWSGGSSTSAVLKYTSDSIRINKNVGIALIENIGQKWNVKIRNTFARDRDSVKIYMYSPNSNYCYYSKSVDAKTSDSIIDITIPIIKTEILPTEQLKTEFIPSVSDICGNEYLGETKIGAIAITVIDRQTYSEILWNSVANVNDMEYKLYETEPEYKLIGNAVNATSFDFQYNNVLEGEKYCFQIVAENDTLKVISNTDCVSLNDDLFWPNAFFPNKIGEFNTFGPKVMRFEPETYKLIIYDKLGGIIFSSSNVTDKWDGYYKGQTMPKGGYPYMAEYTIAGRKYVKQGIVTVIF